jgi:hypothetical protein
MRGKTLRMDSPRNSGTVTVDTAGFGGSFGFGLGASFEFAASFDFGGSFEFGGSLDFGESFDFDVSFDFGMSFDFDSLDVEDSFDFGGSFDFAGSFDFGDSFDFPMLDVFGSSAFDRCSSAGRKLRSLPLLPSLATLGDGGLSGEDTTGGEDATTFCGPSANGNSGRHIPLVATPASSSIVAVANTAKRFRRWPGRPMTSSIRLSSS